MIKSIIFDLIYNKTENVSLKHLIKQNFETDQWNIINDLKKLDTNTLNPYDKKVYEVFFCRTCSLSNKYSDSYKIIEQTCSTVPGLDSATDAEKALTGFIYHSFAVALGYMGKKYDARFKQYFQDAEKYYNQLGAENDILLLNLHIVDIDMYYYSSNDDLIKRLEKLYENHDNDVLNFFGIPFRIGILHLQFALKGEKPRIEKSMHWFSNAIEFSNNQNYKDYWSCCGLVICQYLISGKVDKSLLENPPQGYKQKARRFPMIWFLLIRVCQLTGNRSEVRELFFDLERRLTKLEDEFSNDEDYKKFILNNYGILIEEWLQSIYEDENFSEIDKFYYIIRVNELLQNRFMTNEMVGFYQNKDGVVDIQNLISGISNMNPEMGLIYFTTRVWNKDNKSIFYLLTASDLSEESTYRVTKFEQDHFYSIEHKFINYFMANSDTSKKDQDGVLEKYGKLLFPDGLTLCKGNTLVVPNNISLRIPVHMGRLNGQYLYETGHFHYLPNLHMAQKNNVENDSVELLPVVYYTTEDEMGVKEAETIEGVFEKGIVTLVPDPGLDEIETKSKGKNIIHIVGHQIGGKIRFKGFTLSIEDIIRAIPGKNRLVMLNICSGGHIEQDGEYPLSHIGTPHSLLKKGTNTVITHNWNLGQEASCQFSASLYNSLLKGNKSNKLIANYPNEMISHNPSDYGGYMIWGS